MPFLFDITICSLMLYWQSIITTHTLRGWPTESRELFTDLALIRHLTGELSFAANTGEFAHVCHNFARVRHFFAELRRTFVRLLRTGQQFAVNLSSPFIEGEILFTTNSSSPWMEFRPQTVVHQLTKASRVHLLICHWIEFVHVTHDQHLAEVGHSLG